MAHRLKESQKKHDKKVAEIATRKSKEGYSVRADLPGHTKPPTLNSHIPDVFAVRTVSNAFGGVKITEIYEVETSSGVDSAQHEAFKRWATVNNARFYIFNV